MLKVSLIVFLFLQIDTRAKLRSKKQFIAQPIVRPCAIPQPIVQPRLLVPVEPLLAPLPPPQSPCPTTCISPCPVNCQCPCNQPIVQHVVQPIVQHIVQPVVPIVQHSQVQIRKGPSVHGLMTNVAPESAGVINPEIASPKAIQHNIIHHDNIVTEHHVVGQDITNHHRHQVDAFGNIIGTYVQQTAQDIVQPVEKVYRNTQVQSNLIDLTSGQNVVFNHGPIKSHGIHI